jgi:hypothetical protein
MYYRADYEDCALMGGHSNLGALDDLDVVKEGGTWVDPDPAPWVGTGTPAASFEPEDFTESELPTKGEILEVELAKAEAEIQQQQQQQLTSKKKSAVPYIVGGVLAAGALYWLASQ